MRQDTREVDVARAERVYRDRGRKARLALTKGGYLEDEVAEVDEGAILDLLTDLLHLVPALGETNAARARLRELAEHAVAQFQRESMI